MKNACQYATKRDKAPFNPIFVLFWGIISP